ncbi:MAG: bifunctional (p)ppGpp synthetase/guanosine-3',5'-bis(diphosphate) 3'-pyrophosphohydrolase [Bacilli bacterium]|nr:bifunctional (p)ppGpp synthetase/guanosine-3',5'-bis(diphosphate) 3'-pyrophosphohydrolase [Bacilli bacterium]
MKNITYNDLEKKILSYAPFEIPKLRKAYEYAKNYHKEQTRASGEPYIIHPLNIAYILANMQADMDTIVAGILHDVVEDTESTLDEIEKKFNKTIRDLVDGVTKMTKLDFDNKKELSAVNIRKIIVSLARDPRIIIIKLVDRLHNMRTLEYKSEKKQQEKALETLEIYVPLAYYIGASKIKDELENIAFRYLKPSLYGDINKQREELKKETSDILNDIQSKIENLLKKNGVKAKFEIRYKDNYSIYKKLLTKINFEMIHDMLSIKVLVKNTRDCYLALMLIHEEFTPINNRFKDYIAKPKTNMYKSIHTTVFGPDNRLIQFQIRTFEMERVAIYGLTSYWFKYKNNARIEMQKDLEENFQFFKSIKELDSTILDNIEFVSRIKKELFSSNIYVYTTSGEVIELPNGATVIDFAYKIHTDIGNSMVAAIVNDEAVSLDYVLENQDRVRIITDNKAYVPKEEWLDKVVTTNAKNKIMDFIKENEDNLN